MDNKNAIMSNEEKKKKVVRTDVNQDLAFIPKNVKLENYRKIPLEDAAALGIVWESIAAEIQSLFHSGQASSGLYKVTVPGGGQLMPFKNEKAFLGSVKAASGAVGGGQARLVPLSIDPTSICTALALMNVEAKLNQLQELSQEILNYLKEKDRSLLEGELAFLIETWNSYKYNWDNAVFSQSVLPQIQEVKKDSLAQIVQIRKQISQTIESKTFFSSKKVREKTNTLKALFETYQLAVYVYSMSIFLEAVLIGNYNNAFLEEEIGKIESAVNGCNEFQRKVHFVLEKNQLYSEMAKQIGWSIVETGTIFLPWAKLPKINVADAMSLARTMQPMIHDLGEIEQSSSSKKSKKLLDEFFEDIREETGVFVDSLNELAESYQTPPELLVDSDNLYLETSDPIIEASDEPINE